MLKRKIFIIITAALALTFFSIENTDSASEYTGEKIIYTISPAGKAEYSDLGEVDYLGTRVSLITFKTRVFGFQDTESIYYDSGTFLPIHIERDISFLSGKEFLVEEYDQKDFKLVIKKFKKGKEIERFDYKEQGPIHNAILMPFYLRTIPDLKIGWSITARFPEKFEIKLDSIEEIKIPAGKFQAYHFTSQPNKFEVWISDDKDRIPLKIKGLGGLGYSLVFKERILPGSD